MGNDNSFQILRKRVSNEFECIFCKLCEKRNPSLNLTLSAQSEPAPLHINVCQIPIS